jgi:hypothetical protein
MIVSVGSKPFFAPVLKTLVHNSVLVKGNTAFHSRNWVVGNGHAFSDVWVLLGCDASSLGIRFPEF